MTAADQSILAELHALLDCVQADGSVAGLDEFQPESLSTLGQTLYGVLDSRADLLAACEAALKCCGPSDGWKGDTAEFLRLCEAAVKKAKDAC